MIMSNCKQCGKEIKRAGNQPGVFCSNACKGDWQRNQKEYNRDWLYEKYVTEGLSTYQIAKIVHRDPKRVYEWIRDYGIPLRERSWDIDEKQVFHDKDYLIREYVNNKRSAKDIADEFGVTVANIFYFLKKNGIERRSIHEARKVKRWGLSGNKNAMFGKTGDKSPIWKGGVTPERQQFYSSREWRAVEKFVIERDSSTCQRCGKQIKHSHKMHIHHMIPFSVKKFRADPSNLVMLCSKCHGFVRSKANLNREFIIDWKEDHDGT